MEIIIENIYLKLNDYLNYLNWYFISIFIVLIFGMTRTTMLNWWTELPFVPKREDKLLWLSGLITILIFLFFVSKESLDWNNIDSVKHYIGSLIQSYVLVIISHNIIFNKINNKLK